jgi:hypothetical protein
VQRPGGGAIGSARRIRRGVFGVDYASTTSGISKTKPGRVRLHSNRLADLSIRITRLTFRALSYSRAGACSKVLLPRVILRFNR